jgi:hypothetical protein
VGLCIGGVGVAHLARDGHEPTLWCRRRSRYVLYCASCVVVGYPERLRGPEKRTESMAKPARGVVDEFVFLLAFGVEGMHTRG